jgi:hypothetical protein
MATVFFGAPQIDQIPLRAVNELEVADLHDRGVGTVGDEVY